MSKPKTAILEPYRLSAVAILASALLGTPAIACQVPGASPSKVAWERDSGAPATSVLDLSPALFGNYALVDTDANSTVVGMWHTILRQGGANGPVYDEVLEQFHDDGTELLISNGLPPALGNVCIGVWKRVGNRAYKLRHMTWNWSAPDNGFGVPGTFAGHFELEMLLRLDARGRSFTGTWTAKNFGLKGEHLPALDAEGVVTGVRITVD